MHKPAQIVFATHDQQLVGRLHEMVGPAGIEVLSLMDVALPEPSCSERDTARMAAYKAVVIAGLTDLPALGYARSFRIDPLLRWDGGGPRWSWPFPWPHTSEELATELTRANDELNSGGYCGPNDRGAYFQCVLCLAWPNADTETFEGRTDGQFVWPYYFKKRKRLILDVEMCFVPDGETVALPCLGVAARQTYSDEEGAFLALGRAFGI